MSVSSEYERILAARNSLRNSLQTLGAGDGTENLTGLAQKIQVLERPTGNQGQILGFVENNQLGAISLGAADANNNIATVITSLSVHPALTAGQAIILNGSIYIIKVAKAIDEPIAPYDPTDPLNELTIVTNAMSFIQGATGGGIFLLEATEWVLDSTTNLYEYTLQANNLYSNMPEIYVSGATVGAVATAAEESAFKQLTSSGHYADTDNNTVHIFAKSAISTNFYVLIRGAS